MTAVPEYNHGVMMARKWMLNEAGNVMVTLLFENAFMVINVLLYVNVTSLGYYIVINYKTELNR